MAWSYNVEVAIVLIVFVPSALSSPALSPPVTCCCSWVLRWGRCQLVIDVGVVDG